MTYLRTIVIEGMALLGSVGTLLCCALPALFVSIGAGAAMASLVTNVPQLVWLSEHKIPLFIFAAIMLVISGATTWINRRTPCPLEPRQAKSCMRVVITWAYAGGRSRRCEAARLTLSTRTSATPQRL